MKKINKKNINKKKIEEKEVLKKAKRKFVKHSWLHIYVKKNAFTPYKNSIFNKFIVDSKEPLLHKNFILYVHEDYLTISSKEFLFEPVKVRLHDKLWVELYCVFNLEGETDDVNLMHDKDDVPI